jgi:hypothetical protein
LERITSKRRDPTLQEDIPRADNAETDTVAGYLSLGETAAWLGVSRNKVRRLLRHGAPMPDGSTLSLRWWRNPLDRREVLIPIEDVDKLAAVSRNK